MAHWKVVSSSGILLTEVTINMLKNVVNKMQEKQLRQSSFPKKIKNQSKLILIQLKF